MLDATALRAAIRAALDATAAGTASDDEQVLAAAVLDALNDRVDDPRVVDTITTAIGPLADLATAPFDELSALQKAIRHQQHEADQAREAPAFSDMSAVYELLVASARQAGPKIRLAPGANIVALDASRRRYLIPAIRYDVLRRIVRSSNVAEARKASREKGAVQYHWSVERTGLVPDPAEMAEKLPLPDGGAYMILYAASIDVVSKKPFLAAVTRFAEELPTLDVMFWDTTGSIPTLWSLRGGFGHGGGADVDLPDEHTAAVTQVQRALATSPVIRH
jgi:hypothetical protein